MGPVTDPDEPLWTTEQAATYCHVSPEYFRVLARRHGLAAKEKRRLSSYAHPTSMWRIPEVQALQDAREQSRGPGRWESGRPPGSGVKKGQKLNRRTKG